MATVETPTTPASPPMPPGVAGAEIAEIDSDLFFEMIEANLFPGRPVFLWDGRIYERMSKTVAHASTSVRIQQVLTARLPDGWLLWPENPLRVTPRHAPLPDNLVVRGPLERYEDEHRHPGPADVGLLVEISVSSLAADLGERAEKWARGLIPFYWVFDVTNRRVIVHEGPEVVDGRGRYTQVRPVAVEGELSLVLDGREVARIPAREFFR